MKRIILMVLAGVLVSLPVFAQQTYKTTVKRTPVKRAPVQRPIKVAPAPAEAEVRSEAMQPDAQLPPEEAVRPVTEPELQPLDREVVEPAAEPPKEAAPGMFLKWMMDCGWPCPVPDPGWCPVMQRWNLNCAVKSGACL